MNQQSDAHNITAGRPNNVGLLFVVAVLSSVLTLSFTASAVYGYFQTRTNVLRFLQQHGWTHASNVEVATMTLSGTGLEEVLTSEGKGDAQSQKGNLAASVAYLTPAEVPEMSTPIDENLDALNAGVEAMPVVAQATSNLPEGVQSLLRKNRKGLEIGRFSTMVIGGDSEECLNLGYSMLGDVGAESDTLDVLVATKQITMAKICAMNGVIVFTCRAGKVTISSRQKKPNDACVRT